jgi:hypothetical protein
MQRINSGKPISVHVLTAFPHFSLETGSVIFSGNGPPAIYSVLTAKIGKTIFAGEYTRKWYNSGKPISVVR